MEMVQVDLPLDKYTKTGLVIMPVGDIQWEGPKGATATSLLKKRIALGMELNALFVGMGDYIDLASPSNRKRLRSAGLYDTALNVIDNAAQQLVEEVYEILKPTTGRWLGLLEGHHFHEFVSGESSDQRLAGLLRTRHLGTTAYIGLRFTRSPSTSHYVNLWVTHGCGGGIRGSAPVNKLEQILPAWDADIFIQGHMTKQAHAPVNRVYPYWGSGGPKLKHTDVHLIGAGGFSKGYELGSKQGQVPRGSYVEQGMMRPAALGNPIIRIRPRRVREGKTERFERDITVEM